MEQRASARRNGYPSRTTCSTLAAVDLRTTARAEIEAVLHEYCYAVDSRDVDAAVELFAPSCQFDWGFGRVARGPEGVREMLSALGRWSATQHQLSNVRISFLTDVLATASSTVLAWHRVAQTEAIEVLYGVYEDDLVLSRRGWLFRARRLRAAGESGFPPVAGHERNFEPIERWTS
jgi:hypothetical protein